MASAYSSEEVPPHRFRVYDPPEVGLPWLSVCLDATGNVLAAAGFASRAEAESQDERFAAAFAEEVLRGRLMN